MVKLTCEKVLYRDFFESHDQERLYFYSIFDRIGFVCVSKNE